MRSDVPAARSQNRYMKVNNEDLFRQQAIKSLSEKKPGPPICLMPRPWLWLGALTVVLFMSAAVLAASAEYSRKESVRGWLVSKQGVVRVTNKTPAIISDVVRRPGDHVEKGEALIYFSSDSTLSDGSSKSQEVLNQLRQEMFEIETQLDLSQELQELDRNSLMHQFQEFDAEVAALVSRIEDQKRRIALSQEKSGRLESAVVDGAVTAWDVLRQREELGVLEQELGWLEQEHASKRREQVLLGGQQDGLPVRSETQRSTLRVRRLQLSQQIAEHESRRLSVLESPVAGIVASVEVHAGYSVAPQQLLMTVLPENTDLAAEVFVPSRAAGFVRPGQVVNIAYDAFPRQKFGSFEGRIERISEFISLPGEIPRAFSLPEASYKVQIAIADTTLDTSIGAVGLRPGMLLAADIILEKRNLFDWLLEPLRLKRSSAG